MTTSLAAGLIGALPLAIAILCNFAIMGTLIAFSMIIAALLSLTIIPALLTMIKPKFILQTATARLQ